jgi:hypothetical protein
MGLDILAGGIVLVALVLAIRVRREDIPALARQFARWFGHSDDPQAGMPVSYLPIEAHEPPKSATGDPATGSRAQPAMPQVKGQDKLWHPVGVGGE